MKEHSLCSTLSRQSLLETLRSQLPKILYQPSLQLLCVWQIKTSPLCFSMFWLGRGYEEALKDIMVAQIMPLMEEFDQKTHSGELMNSWFHCCLQVQPMFTRVVIKNSREIHYRIFGCHRYHSVEHWSGMGNFFYQIYFIDAPLSENAVFHFSGL